MGKQIAGLLILLGYDVNIWNYREIDLSSLNIFMQKNEPHFGNKGGSAAFIQDINELPDALTIEALVEDVNIKKTIFSQLQHKITKGYFTNTSSFGPSEISSDIGVLHFFNPIRMKFIEFMPSKKQGSEINELLCQLESLGFLKVQVKDHRCFLGNFILFHEFSMFFKLIEIYNYSFAEIEQVIGKLYGDRDILKIVDIIGVDVTLKIMENLKEKESDYYVSKILAEAVKCNILGYKNKTSIKDLLTKLNP